MYIFEDLQFYLQFFFFFLALLLVDTCLNIESLVFELHKNGTQTKKAKHFFYFIFQKQLCK